MCGIYANINTTQVEVIKKLKQLEYRGYDSWGYCFYDKNRFWQHKQTGKISGYNNLPYTNKYSIISHTRWASNGNISIDNTHPIIYEDVAVVHNGIVEKTYKINKYGLFSYKGKLYDINLILDKIPGDTDTKLITALLNIIDINDIFDYVGGSYAIVCLKQGIMYAFCNEMPLYISSDGEVSSDYNVFDNGSKFLKCKDKTNYCINLVETTDKSRFNLRIQDNSSNTSISEKTMLDEIKEQATLFDKKIKVPKSDYKRHVFIGCGTSYHAGMIGKFLANDSDTRASYNYGSEFDLFDTDEDNDKIIVITQSGETKDIIDILRGMDNDSDYKYDVTLLTNNPSSTCGKYVNSIIYTDVGVENGVAATKTFFGQILALLKYFQYKFDLYNCKKEIDDLLNNKLDDIKNIANFISKYRNCLYLGHGICYPLALEGALKMKEVSYIHAEGIPSAEIKHGNIALIDDDTLSIFIDFCSEGVFKSRIKNNINQIKCRGGKTIFISDDKIEDTDYFIQIPKMTKYKCLLYSIVILQLLAHFVAEHKGLDSSRPRNLCKSVTVN